MLTIGLMSGTSLDGIDTVLCDISGEFSNVKIKQIDFFTEPFDENLKSRIRQIINNEQVSTELICSVNFELGKAYSNAVKKMINRHNLRSEDIEFVANHGQTLYHLPKGKNEFISSTLQMGESSIIAYENKVDVIDNFRVMDIAAGGEGAPLVPFSEKIIYQEKDRIIALQNIGGISNVTLLKNDSVVAFDCGPGNMMIDEAMRFFYQKNYDENGDIASSAKIDNDLLNELKEHPYLERTPPKSTGREEFGEVYVKELIRKYSYLEPSCIVSTFTEFCAYAIQDSYRKFLRELPNKMIVGGGGAYNLSLMTRLRSYLPEVEVLTQEDCGFSSDAKEAIAFVVLGYAFLKQVPANVKEATGAKDLVILGKLTPNPFKRK
jgi:anhydro-N-acetylmuramic acid kinase